MLFVQPLPTPCSAGRFPDATGMDAFTTAYRAAKEQQVVFVAIERLGLWWTVKADALTAPQRTFDTTVHGAVRDAVDGELRAQELAVALHAAFYGALEPLARAAPPAS
ncbi:hypothetical protein AB0E25_40470 [Streptomyces bobili]|uniref:hypothetical protein n=1 Tax=Streptomyces bobili TaxID=67280 RepID=UPI0033F2737E